MDLDIETVQQSLCISSIFAGIRRSHIPSTGDLLRSHADGSPVRIPIKFVRRWVLLIGTIKRIRIYDDGLVLVLDTYPCSFTENWPETVVWIPSNSSSSAGVLI